MNRYIALCKVIEVGSFSKAASLLNYSQSGISQMIQSIEEELSLKILFRSRTGVRLTPEGEELLPLIQTAVNSYRALIEKSNEIKGLQSGIIRIGTFTSISSNWLPKMIKEFQKIYPNVQFILHQGDYSLIPEWVRMGEIDFGFVNPKAVKDLKTISLKKGNMLAVIPKNNPLSKNEYVTLKELSTEPFLLLEEGSLSEPLEAFHAQNLEPNIKLCIHDDYSILSMVEADLGVSILAELLLQRADSYNVSIKNIVPPVEREIGIVFKDLKTMPIASKYFIDYMKNNIPD